MKRLLLSILTVGLVSAGAFAATRAYFTDSATIEGAQITTGEISIEPSQSTSIPILFDNMKPGDLKRKYVTFTNDGTLPIGFFNVSKTNVNDTANLLSQIIASVQCKIVGGSEDYAFFTNDWGTKPTVAEWYNNSDILDNSFYRTAAGTIPVGSKYQCALDFIMPTSVGNDFMGQTATFDLVFTAEQVH